MHEIKLTHFTDTGHRIVGHEGGRGKCARLHGHTYRWEVTVMSPSLLPIGFVMDFGEIKRTLDEWDHRTLLWVEDPILDDVFGFMDRLGAEQHGLVAFPFNPTAENMARYMSGLLFTKLQIAHAKGDEVMAEGEGYFVQIELWETPKSCARFVAR